MSASQSSRLFAIGLVATNIAWFAGLWRLLGEGVVRGLSAMAPTEATLRAAVASLVVAAIVLVAVAFLLWRWPALQLLRQTRADLRAYRGVPPKAADVAELNLRPIAVAVAGMVVPAMVLAALLPGPIAAGVAVVVGLRGALPS
jgi:signal transduction histidine kinase